MTPKSLTRRNRERGERLPALPSLYGLYSSVARRENVTRQFVQQVAKGRRTSKRIQAALARETRKLLRKLTEEAA